MKEKRGEVLQPEKLDEYHTVKINNTVALVLEGKHPSKKIPSCATLGTYEETPILIPVGIREEAI